MRIIIQRYLGSKFILPFIASCLFFVFFLLTFQLFKITKLVINKGVSFTTVASLLGHISISFLPMAIPLSALFASIYALNKLSSDSEVLSMRSFGLSKGRLFFPFFILGLLIAAMIFALNQSLIPYSQKQFKSTIALLTSKAVLADIKKGQFYTEIPNVTIFAEDVEDEGKTLFDVFIHIQDEHEAQDKVIYAKRGYLLKQEGNEFADGASLRMRLKDGNIIKNFQNPSNLEKIIFHEYEFPISSAEMKSGPLNADNTLTTTGLLKILRENPQRQTETMTRAQFILLELEFWSRLNTPLLCIIFILLGFSLGIQKSRGKNHNSALICFLSVGIYYAAYFTSINLARNEHLPSWLAVFLPTLLTFLLGRKFFTRLEWVA